MYSAKQRLSRFVLWCCQAGLQFLASNPFASASWGARTLGEHDQTLQVPPFLPLTLSSSLACFLPPFPLLPSLHPFLPSFRCFNPTVYQISLKHKDWEAVGRAIHGAVSVQGENCVGLNVWTCQVLPSAAAALLRDDIKPTVLGLSKGDTHTEGVWGSWHIPVLSTAPWLASSCCSASHFLCVFL